MAYTRINWQDGESGGTPLSAENLNKMDEGIYELDNKIDELDIELDKKVEMEYLGQNPDINSKRFTAGIYGLYGCTQAPDTEIAVLEVIFYTPDWVIQRFTTVEATPRMWERSFTSGTTWNNWVRRW